MFAYCHILGPFLIVAPLSTLSHWAREFETWTNLNAGTMDECHALCTLSCIMPCDDVSCVSYGWYLLS